MNSWDELLHAKVAINVRGGVSAKHTFLPQSWPHPMIPLGAFLGSTCPLQSVKSVTPLHMQTTLASASSLHACCTAEAAILP